MKRILCFVVFFAIMQLFSSALAGKRETRTVQVGEVFTVYTTSKYNMKNVVWNWDYDVLEVVESIGTYSTSLKFRAKKSTPSAGVVIQAITYYYVTNGSYTYVAKEVDSYTIHATDNTTVSFAESEYEIEYDIPGQSSANYIEAITSNDSYSGGYKWNVSNYDYIYLNADGNRACIHPRNVGQTMLTVTLDNGNFAQCSIKVVAPKPQSVEIDSYMSLVVGDGQYLKPNLSPTFAETTYSWSTDDSSIASVNSSGYVVGKSAGSTYIRIKTANGKTDACRVTVTAKQPKSISLPETITILTGESRTLEAKILPVDASYSLTWKSSNENVVTISKEGKIYAVAEGLSIITASTQNGKSASCRVIVKVPQPTSLSLSSNKFSIYEGEKKQIQAIVLPKNSEYYIEWTSSDESVASVSDGIVTAKQIGNCIINAKTSNGLHAKCLVSVLKKNVEPESLSLPTEAQIIAGDSMLMDLTIFPSNAETVITWSSSDTDIACVNNGIINAIAEGRCIITAKSDNGLEASCRVIVSSDKSSSESQYNSDWTGSYFIKSALTKFENPTYDYPADFLISIDDVDGKLYVTSLIGLDCTKTYPYTGIPVKVESATSAILELDVTNDAGSFTNEGKNIDGLHLLSANSEYNSSKPGEITLSKNEDGEIYISDFYVFYFGFDSNFEYRKDVNYSNNKGNNVISAGLTNVDSDYNQTTDIEIFNLEGIRVYKGAANADIQLVPNFYIIKQGKKIIKVLIKNSRLN